MLITDQEQGYFPFGGGKHSHPGRSYAFVQTLAIVVVLIGRFDIRGEDGGLIKVPCMFRSRLGDAVTLPCDQNGRIGAGGAPNSLGDRAGRTLSGGLVTVKSAILFAANKRLLMTEWHRKGWTVTIVVRVTKSTNISPGE